MTTPIAIIALLQTTTSSGAVLVVDPTNAISLQSLLDQFGRRWNTMLAVNFKRLGMPLPAGVAAVDDLYGDAPAEIRRSNSMHFVAPGDVENWPELIEQLQARDALAVVFTTKDREELLQGLKLYLAWYADPGALAVQFEEGSEHLAKGLLTGAEAVLLKTSSGHPWRLYLPPGSRFD